MTLPNPLEPFVINVSLTASAIVDERTRRFVLVSSGDTSQAELTPIACDASNWKTLITSTTSESGKFASTFFSQEKAGDKIFYILEVGTSGNIQDKLKKVEQFIDEQTFNAWLYVLPTALLNDAYLGTLLTKYNTTASRVYFMGKLDNKPAESAFFNSYCKGNKSFWANYDNLADSNFNINGVMAGIMASSSYDISSGNRMSSFNRKKTPNKFTPMTKSDVDAVTQASCNFGGSLKGTMCVLNGRFCDTKPFSFWFSFDNIYDIVTAEMIALALNSTNTPNSALTFNDLGISIAEGRIITALESCRALGYLDIFGTNLDPATNKILNQGRITSVDAETYRIQNPTKYTAGIYDGFSAYIQIQGYIEQINFNLTIG